jgi:hypothetical protein
MTTRTRLQAGSGLMLAGWLLVLALGCPAARAEGTNPEEARIEIRELEQKAARLKAEGKQDDAKALMHKAKELRAQAGGGEKARAPGAEEEQQIAHVRQAMEHLKAAGMGDLAERVGQEAKRRHEEAKAREARPDASEIEQLRAEVQELRQHVRKLSARLEESERKP